MNDAMMTYHHQRCLQRFSHCRDAVKFEGPLRDKLETFLQCSFPSVSSANTSKLEVPVSVLLAYAHQLFTYYRRTTEDRHWHGRFYPYLLLGFCYKRAHAFGVVFRQFSDLQRWFKDFPETLHMLSHFDSRCGDRRATLFLATTIHILVHCSAEKTQPIIALQLSKNMLLQKYPATLCINMIDSLAGKLYESESEIAKTCVAAEVLVHCSIA